MCKIFSNSKALLFSSLIALFVKSTIGVRCWVCDEQTEIECFINGSEMDCPNRHDTCFYEQRQRLGETYHVRQEIVQLFKKAKLLKSSFFSPKKG